MSIIWSYLDKRSATVDAIRDYGNMQFIIDHTDDEVRAAYERMGGVRGQQFDGMPRGHNPLAAEDRMVKGIEEIDLLRERYRQAAEYMAWFTPAWMELTEDEQYVLGTFYSDAERQTDAIYDICERFHIERTSAYKRKNRALQKLATLLYGKG